jgi:endonuclease G
MSHEDDANVDLEAIPRPDRPALVIQDGDFPAPPPDWEQLNDKRKLLRGIFPSVGLLELVNPHGNRTAGTAFLAGLGILMTNKHVVENFGDHDAAGRWSILPGMTVRIDFRRERDRPEPSELPVEGIIGVHPKYDLALLRVPTTLDDVLPRKILRLEPRKPEPLAGREVVTIGYPERDSTVTDEQATGVFQNIFGVKRLQPGRITSQLSHGGALVVRHDCSTTDGNSGSCIIDLATGNVLALHFGGTAAQGNLAVPLWEVADEPMMRDLQWAT